MIDTQQTQQASSPLLGRRVLVTGASSGIGWATARVLASHGAQVALLARRAERLTELAQEIDSAGGHALALPADVTEFGQVQTAVDRATAEFGGVDVLVNSAGIMLPGLIAEADPADWDRMVSVNLMGSMYAARAVLPGMLERGQGHIINVSSNSGRVHQPSFAAYAATKHALGAFTTILRKEVYPSRLRVTLLEPGATESELSQHADQEVLGDLLAGMGDGNGMRLMTTDDVANAILWSLTAPPHVNVGEILYTPVDQRDW